MNRPCLRCQELVASGSYCAECKPKRKPRPSRARGYDRKHEELSRQARRLQPWCSDCLTHGGPKNPLTLDHTPQAWAKVNAGKRLTIKDVAAGLAVVRCLRCNIAAGAARGANVTR